MGINQTVYVDVSGQPASALDAAELEAARQAGAIAGAAAGTEAGREAGTAAATEAAELAMQSRLARDANLSDVSDVAASRDNLGLGDAATRDVGTTGGTVADGGVVQALGVTVGTHTTEIANLEAAVAAISAGFLRFATVALMDADTTQADGQLAYVYDNNGSPSDPANGMYQWDDGASLWVLAVWYTQAVAAVVQPLVDAAAASAAAAAVSAGTASTAATSLNDRYELINADGVIWAVKAGTGPGDPLTIFQLPDLNLMLPDPLTGEYSSVQAVMRGSTRLIPGENGLFFLTSTVDGAEKVVAYWDLNADLQLAGLDGGVRENIIALQERPDFARVEYNYPVYANAPNAWPDWFGVEAYGQSNAVGSNGQPAFTLIALFPTRALTFNGGPKADPDNAPATMASVMPLVEDDLSGDGGGNRGETFISMTVNGVLERLYVRTGQPLDDFPVLTGHTAGISGKSIGVLASSLPAPDGYYLRFETSLEQFVTLAAPGTYWLGVILWDQGEANQGQLTSTIAAYAASLRALYDKMVLTASTTTGQPFPPLMLVCQKSYLAADQALPNPASVTLAVTLEQGDGIIVAFPDYCTFFIPESDGTHRGPIGHAMAGMLFSRVAERVMWQQQDWRGLSAVSVRIQYGYCFLKLLAPVAPVVLDYDYLGPATQAGFRLVDADGDVPLSDPVVVGDGTTVRFTLGRPVVTEVDGDVKLRGGLDYLPQFCGLIPNSGGTNLRDSDVEIVNINGETKLLANWLLAFEMSALIMET